MSIVRDEAATQKAIEIAVRLLAFGKYTEEEIAQVTTLPVEKVKELVASTVDKYGLRP